MLKSNEQLLVEFYALIPLIESLAEVTEAGWKQPVAPGKWPAKAVVCHLMLWDKYFYEEAILKIGSSAEVTSKDLDFEVFNAGAAEYAEAVTGRQAAEDCIHYRKALVDAIAAMEDERIERPFPDGDGRPFTVRGYMKDFIGHDRHHARQLDKWLHALRTEEGAKR